MLIKEYLQQYLNLQDTDNVAIFTHIRLEQLFNQLIEQSPEWAPIIKYILQYHNGLLSPMSVQQTCKRLWAVETIEALEKIINAFDWNIFYNILNPKFVLNDLPTIHGNELINKLKDSWLVFDKQLDVTLVDVDYRVLNMAVLNELLKACPYNNLKYQTSVFDCDDFALTTKAWINLHAGGANTFGYAHATFYRSNNKGIFAHAFNIALVEDDNGKYKPIVIEPQNDHRIVNAFDMKHWFMGIEKVVITYLYF